MNDTARAPQPSQPATLPARTDPRGLAAAASAFFIWGLLPLYLKALQGVPVVQITAHRLVWGCLFAFLWLWVRSEVGNVRAALRDPNTRWRLCASATLISINWLTYVYGIAANRVVETSLGYFINPLVNVLLGVLLLSERLNAAQWTAVTIAAAGVAWLTWTAGHPPWISLTLAFSFGLYGLVRKVISVDALAGFASETGQATQLGQFELVVEATVNFGARPVTGAGTYTFAAANGDRLVADHTGFSALVVPGVVLITEHATIDPNRSTGRFAGAEGTFTVERLADAATGVGGLTAGTFEGTISLPGPANAG
jgi:RarD protein